MNTAQTIFTIFFGLYFAITIQNTSKLSPFDTASMTNGIGSSWKRFILSFLILNVLPLSYFIIIFRRLQSFSPFEINFLNLFLLFILSLFGFGVYRFYYGLMILRNKDENYIFYSESDFPKSLKDDLNTRPNNHKQPKNHIIPGIIWILITIILICCFLK